MKRVSPQSRAFTLMELLVVITIIIILAGLTLSMIGFANKKGAMERCKSEISAMCAALESYKADNGDYPKDTNTNKIDARTSPSVIISTSGNTDVMLASVALYKALSGDIGGTPRQYGAVDTATNIKQTVYLPFKSNMLWPKCAPGATPTAVTALVDPFRNVYGYSTIGGDPASSGTTGTPKGYNPTYDLWSTVDVDQKGATSLNAWISNFR
jgi:type II secretory pathway pseudopilin PulG